MHVKKKYCKIVWNFGNIFMIYEHQWNYVNIRKDKYEKTQK